MTTAAALTPPTSYYGSKVRLAPWIVSMLPAHRTYIEPFLGAGAVLFAKRSSATEIAGDRDGQVVNFFRMLRERPGELERACWLTPYARAEFDACDPDEPGLDDLERARRWFVRINQSVGKISRRRSGWAVTHNTGGADHAHKHAAMVGRMLACAERLRTVHVENRPAVELLTRHATADTAVYCDPPYLATVRSSRTKRPGLDYAHEYSTEAEHRELAEVLHATPAAVLLSGYDGPLYAELYGDWWQARIVISRPMSNGRGRTGAPAVEVVWSNRPLAVQGSLDLQPTEPTPES